MKNIKKTIVFFPVILSLFVALGVTEKVYTQKKSYVEELEEAFAAKISNDRANKNSDISETVIKKAKKDANIALPGDENAIGKEAVNYLKTSIKSPLLDFLSSSELTEWATVKARYENSKKALEIFGAKYKTELESGKQVAITAQPTVPTPTVPATTITMPTQPTAPAPAKTIPGLKTATPIAAIPSATTAKPALPTTTSAQASTQPGLVAGPDEEIVEVIEEVEEESTPAAMPTATAPATAMPTVKAPATMPVAAPASPMTARPTAPVAVAPKATMPTAAAPSAVQYSIPAPKPAAPTGGMPMAK